MSNPVASGRCLCGRVSYRIGGAPIWSGYCHCESCRRFSGAVVTNWLGIAPGDLEFVAGQPSIYADRGVRRGFCADCGSSLTYETDRFPDYIQLHIGSLDHPDEFEPRAHVHCRERVAWFEVADELPRHAGSAADADNDWMKR